MKNNLSRVKNLRTSLNITQQELANRAGINLRQIQKYESGEYDIGNMTLKNAIALSDALGCDIKELLKSD
ncbi:helix-turn-helix domain-containing protein [Faecalimonas umbilicata]|uniref:helix-turn-helix domain-containing protein n=1 Tax=Faecalimonas umbilicata TaxID=1912855 RepID=UPI0022E75CB2|nr:helix-turn-helix transcriptional regulator [Faecalimonas umbilicata]